ncbi:MAG: redox-sensing transcriptional repressor Rex [Micrococcales bacterium]|nr:redox-sensing transcriptional repressor Rex [Micrococcales bacterium]
MSADPTQRRDVPDATVARLPEYLRTLSRLAERGIHSVSSEELAAAVGVRSAQLRKDLSHLGSYGVRGVGYEVETLALEISRVLGLTGDWPVAIVGMGNLGRALASYSGFVTKGFRIVGLFDDDPHLEGEQVGGITIRPLHELAAQVEEHPIAIGVIATPSRAAQDVCDSLVAAGVASILNFAPVTLTVPVSVDVRRVDLSTELQILAFHAQRRALAAAGLNERGDRRGDDLIDAHQHLGPVVSR